MMPVRGDGVGIEVTESLVRGVRLDHTRPGRAVAAAELAFPAYDDGAARDAFVLLRAELGEPQEPTRIAAFPAASTLQRLDVTGRTGPELNALRSRLDRLHSINSTMLLDDGPRRWLFLVRWDAVTVRRLEDLAERAGFVDVAVEPSPLAVARVVTSSTTFVRRAAAQGESYRMVVAGGLPVAADGAGSRVVAPTFEVSDVDVTLAWFDDFLTEPALGEHLHQIDTKAHANAELQIATARRVVSSESTATVTAPAPPTLTLGGVAYPDLPDSDLRSAIRQAASLGAAVGAAGLAGTLRPVDIIGPALGVDDGFDRPWAVERISDLAPVDEPEPPSIARRVRGRFRLRRSR